jgi:hypothetical protein
MANLSFSVALPNALRRNLDRAINHCSQQVAANYTQVRLPPETWPLT